MSQRRDDLALSPQVALVVLLYAIQGVPSGFIDNFLPVILYAKKQASISAMGLLSALSFPWMLKFLWAPFIDAYGTKKAWLMPLLTCNLLCCAYCMTQDVDNGVGASLILALVVYTTATGCEDCVVDGYAMMLAGQRGASSRMLAIVNSAQVVGWKFGTFYAGAPVWYVYESYGWEAIWALLAFPTVVAMIVLLFMPEPPAKRSVKEKGVISVSSSVLSQLQDQRMRKQIMIMLLLKGGEKVLHTMYRPYLVDEGIPASTVGEWVGLYATTSSALGSLVGSYLVDLLAPCTAVEVTLVLRFAIVAGALMLPGGPVALALLGFSSGIVTPPVFAYTMQSASASSHPVTSYTLLQCCDDVSRFIGYSTAGFMVEAFGYNAVFAGAALSMLAPFYPVATLG